MDRLRDINFQLYRHFGQFFFLQNGIHWPLQYNGWTNFNTFINTKGTKRFVRKPTFIQNLTVVQTKEILRPPSHPSKKLEIEFDPDKNSFFQALKFVTKSHAYLHIAWTSKAEKKFHLHKNRKLSLYKFT